MNIRDITAEILSKAKTPLTAVEICALIKTDRTSVYRDLIDKYKTEPKLENSIYSQAVRAFQAPANTLSRPKIKSDYRKGEVDGKRKARFWVVEIKHKTNSDSSQGSLAAELNSQIQNHTEVNQAGAGFGDPVENKIVEQAAVRAVEKDYQRQGWIVRSVEQHKCGFDLECSKDGRVEHVEVKGVRGNEMCFIITSGEVKQAREDTRFFLTVVSSALSESPKLTKFSGAEFCRQFDLGAIQYRAVLKR